MICRYCSVLWLHHDGTARGANAGAKAWKEIPSAVHSIERVEIGGNGGDDSGAAGPRAERFVSDRLRWWEVKKCRMGTHREFQYEINPDTRRPSLTPAGARCVVQDAREALVQELWDAYQRGEHTRSRSDLAAAMRERWNYSNKTTDNSLSRLAKSRHPEVCRLSTPRGHYKLAPRVVEMLTAAAAKQQAGEAQPLNTSMPQGKEQDQTTVIDRDLVTSREVPEGTTSDQPAEPPKVAEFPRENLGKSAPACAGNGSGHIPSRGPFTSRAREVWRRGAKLSNGRITLHGPNTSITVLPEELPKYGL